MPGSSAEQLKDRIRADLKLALKAGRKAEMSVLRTLLAAIDNADAPARTDAELRYDPDAASEVDRLDLSPAQLRDLLAHERDARLAGADEMDHAGQTQAAKGLRAEAALVETYFG